jgi:hypothetical protein
MNIATRSVVLIATGVLKAGALLGHHDNQTTVT